MDVRIFLRGNLMETETHFVENSKYTVLFVHGILGSPFRFHDLYPFIPSDFSIIKVVLDGHGKKARDFSHTSLRKWRDQIHSLLEELKKKEQKVIFVGHSMGCLLGMEEALKKESGIECLFLLNVPLRAKIGWTSIKQCCKCAFGNPKNYDAMTRNLIENCCIEISHNPFVYLGWIPRFFDLFTLIRQTRKIVPYIKVKTICFHSGKDELVRKRALKDLRKNQGFEIHIQKNAGHYYLDEKDTKEMEEVFCETLKLYTEK